MVFFKFYDKNKTRKNKTKLKFEEVIKLAKIVEKEVLLDEERD